MPEISLLVQWLDSENLNFQYRAIRYFLTQTAVYAQNQAEFDRRLLSIIEKLINNNKKGLAAINSKKKLSNINSEYDKSELSKERAVLKVALQAVVQLSPLAVKKQLAELLIAESLKELADTDNLQSPTITTVTIEDLLAIAREPTLLEDIFSQLKNKLTSVLAQRNIVEEMSLIILLSHLPLTDSMAEEVFELLFTQYSPQIQRSQFDYKASAEYAKKINYTMVYDSGFYKLESLLTFARTLEQYRRLTNIPNSQLTEPRILNRLFFAACKVVSRSGQVNSSHFADHPLLEFINEICLQIIKQDYPSYHFVNLIESIKALKVISAPMVNMLAEALIERFNQVNAPISLLLLLLAKLPFTGDQVENTLKKIEHRLVSIDSTDALRFAVIKLKSPKYKQEAFNELLTTRQQQTISDLFKPGNQQIISALFKQGHQQTTNDSFKAGHERTIGDLLNAGHQQTISDLLNAGQQQEIDLDGVRALIAAIETEEDRKQALAPLIRLAQHTDAEIAQQAVRGVMNCCAKASLEWNELAEIAKKASIAEVQAWSIEALAKQVKSAEQAQQFNELVITALNNSNGMIFSLFAKFPLELLQSAPIQHSLTKILFSLASDYPHDIDLSGKFPFSKKQVAALVPYLEENLAHSNKRVARIMIMLFLSLPILQLDQYRSKLESAIRNLGYRSTTVRNLLKLQEQIGVFKQPGDELFFVELSTDVPLITASRDYMLQVLDNFNRYAKDDYILNQAIYWLFNQHAEIQTLAAIYLAKRQQQRASCIALLEETRQKAVLSEPVLIHLVDFLLTAEDANFELLNPEFIDLCIQRSGTKFINTIFRNVSINEVLRAIRLTSDSNFQAILKDVLKQKVTALVGQLQLGDYGKFNKEYLKGFLAKVDDPVEQLQFLEAIFARMMADKSLYARNVVYGFFTSWVREGGFCSMLMSQHVKILKESFIAVLTKHLASDQDGRLKQIAQNSTQPGRLIAFQRDFKVSASIKIVNDLLAKDYPAESHHAPG